MLGCLGKPLSANIFLQAGQKVVGIGHELD
jgi:hypothetical protein